MINSKLQEFNMREHIRHSNLIEGVTNPDEIDVSMNAWEYLLKRDFLTETVVLKVHDIIMHWHLHESRRGVWRKSGVMVGGRVCPHYIEIPILMHEWLESMRTYWENISPRDMHVAYEHVHPFVDGNGRTGRMFMWFHEMLLGQEPTLIKYAEREAYYEWF